MSIETGIAALALKKLSDRRKRVALMAVAMCVVFATTYALILPALTIDQETAQEQSGIEVAQQEQKDADGAKDAATSDASGEKAADQDQAADQQAQEPAASTDAGSEGEKAAAAADSTQEGSDQQASAPADKDSEDTPIAAVGSVKAEKGHFAAEVQYDEDAKLPQGTSLKVTPFEETSKEYKEAYKAVVKQKKAEDLSFDEDAFQLIALDISLVDADGKEIEPQSQVQVKLKAKDLIGNESVEDVQIRHLNEQTDKVELVAGSKKGKLKVDESVSAEFKVDSFSTFVITYSNSTWRSITAYVVDTLGDEIDAGTLSNKNLSSASWTDVANLKPSANPEEYDYVEARANSATGDVVHSIRYSSYKFQYRVSSSDSAQTLTSLYFVYQKNDGKISLTINKNGGSEDIAPIRVEKYGSVVLPEYSGTRSGYTFVGYAESEDKVEADKTYRKIFKPGEAYEMGEDDATLYVAWQSSNPEDTTALFFIRKDGTIPDEPGHYATSAYSSGISISGAITVQHWVVDNDVTKPWEGNCVQNDVRYYLNSVPTDAQIKAVFSSYNPDTDYILWYVQKKEDDGWHVDGVLLKKELVSISYNANEPAGTTRPDTPLGYQEIKGTEVNIGSGGSKNGTVVTPSINGYTFVGWNTQPDGSGDMYQPNDKYALNQNTTLYAIWAKGSNNVVTVKKVDESQSILNGAQFTLQEMPAGSPISISAGSYTNRNIKTDTVYALTETSAPQGYKKHSNTVYFVIKNQGGTMVAFLCDQDGKQVQAPDGISLVYANQAATITVSNDPYLTTVNLEKVDQAGNALSGATFQLKKDQAIVDGYSSIQPNNKATISDLRDGSYSLTETRPPDGYLMVADPIEFEISNGVVSFANTTYVTFDSTNNTFTVKNQAGEKLPNTGGSGTQLYTFLGALLLFAAAGGMYVSRSRRAGRRSE